MSDRQAMRAKLVLATVDVIERVGLPAATVREIAREAGVNVAAIGYYFGSKQELIQYVLDDTFHHLLADLTTLTDRLDSDPEGAARETFGFLLEGALRYPRLTRAHLHDLFTGVSDSGALPQGLAPLIRKLATSIAAAGVGKELALRRAVQAFSAVLFPAFFGGFFAPAGALKTRAARSRYVAEVVAAAFTPSPGTPDVTGSKRGPKPMA